MNMQTAHIAPHAPAQASRSASGGLRVLIAGGGTGGHIFPALAVAAALRAEDPRTEFLFVGARGKMEMEKVPQAGYTIEGLDIAGFNRSALHKNILLPFKLIRSFFQVRRILRRFRPQAVLGVGGYSTFPVLRLAQGMGIPTFIHESNSLAGRSNILLGKRATRIFTAGPGMEKYFPADRIVITGNPVRPDIARAASIPKAEALAFFGLTPGRPVLLAMGGSLGARSINEAVQGGLDRLLEAGLQVVWQTGKNGAEGWKGAASGKPGVWVDTFISRMDLAYAASDMVLSRAGAMAIAELATVGRPTVFVPYPHAAEDHQTANARHLAGQDAALMVKDSEAAEGALPLLLRLAGDEDLRRKLAENIRRTAVEGADRLIAEHIRKTVMQS